MRLIKPMGLALVLATAGLLGAGVREARAQPGVPYGPYSMTRSQFNQYAPAYYPRLNTNIGYPFYGPRYGPRRRVYVPRYRGVAPGYPTAPIVVPRVWSGRVRRW